MKDCFVYKIGAAPHQKDHDKDPGNSSEDGRSAVKNLRDSVNERVLKRWHHIYTYRNVQITIDHFLKLPFIWNV